MPLVEGNQGRDKISEALRFRTELGSQERAASAGLWPDAVEPGWFERLEEDEDA
jgi:hypothetical protein